MLGRGVAEVRRRGYRAGGIRPIPARSAGIGGPAGAAETRNENVLRGGEVAVSRRIWSPLDRQLRMCPRGNENVLQGGEVRRVPPREDVCYFYCSPGPFFRGK